MENELLLKNLQNVLKQKFLKKESYTQFLSDILKVSKNSVHLKLNGKVRFSFEEVTKITRALSIPLGSLVDDYSYVGSHPMDLLMVGNMWQEDGYAFAMDKTRSIFEQTIKRGYTKFTGVCKNLPVISYYYYEWLLKFAHIKWFYFNSGSADMPPLPDVNGPDFEKMKNEYTDIFNTIRRLVFVIDSDLTRNYIQDLVFFRKIGGITVEELGFVLDDLERLLVDIEEICRIGFSRTSGQEIAIFYSDITLYNDIYLLESSSCNVGIFYAQGFIPILHQHPQTFYVMRDWVDGWLRCSNPICGTASKERQTFFKCQHDMVKDFRRVQLGG